MKLRNNYNRLILLFAFYLACSFIWIKLDTRLPGWDQSVHIGLSLDYLHLINNFKSDTLMEMLDKSDYYPPLYHLLIVPFHMLFGISDDNFIYINIFFLFMALFSLMQVGRMLYSEMTGFLAGVMLCSVPFWLWNLYNCLIDLPLTAIVLFSFFIYMKSQDFSNRKYSILFGITMGLGILLKWTFVFYVIIPFMYYAVKSVREEIITRDKTDKNRIVLFAFILIALFFLSLTLLPIFTDTYLPSLLFLFAMLVVLFFKTKSSGLRTTNIAMLIIVVFLLIFPWYFRHFFQLLGKFGSNMGDAIRIEGDPAVFSIPSFTYYIRAAINGFPVIFLMFLFSGILAFAVKWRKENIHLILWTVPALVFMTLISNKDKRYILPLYPFLALVSTHWLIYIGNRRAKEILVCCLLIFGLLSFYINSFIPSQILPNIFISRLFVFKPYIPRKADWKQMECIRKIIDENKNGYGFISTTIVANHNDFHEGSFRYLMNLMDTHNPEMYFRFLRKKFMELNDFIIYKTGDRGICCDTGPVKSAVASIENGSELFTKTFEPISYMKLPDQSCAVIYKLHPQQFLSSVSIRDIAELIKSNIHEYGLSEGGVSIELSPASAVDTRCGYFRYLKIWAPLVNFQGLVIKDFSIKLKNITVNMPALVNDGKLIFMKIEEIEPGVSITSTALKNFILSRITQLKIESLNMNENSIILEGYIKNISLKITASIKYMKQEKKLRFRVDEIRIAKYFRIPHFVHDAITTREMKLVPSWGLPVFTNIREINIIDNVLKVR